MDSTYVQFIESFKNHLQEEATVGGDDANSSTEIFNAIIASLDAAHLKELMDELDTFRRTRSSDLPVAADPAPVAPKRTTKSRAKNVTDPAKAPDGATTVTVTTTATKKPHRVTGYNEFISQKVSKENMQMKEAAGIWKGMSADDKKIFNDLATAKNAVATTAEAETATATTTLPGVATA